MKYKTTIKALRSGAVNLRSAGYCDMHYLLYGRSPVAYTSGMYGWNFDVYECYGLTICTGYRGTSGERLQHMAEYEARAREIVVDPVRSFDHFKVDVEQLLKEFCILNGGYAE
jgi:hypothetical protein